ncbi:VOC family protein [Arthrobacter castelli]|uniref:VOC family protein n=1 Tax=Arthrobacter castelli TaxID=271431 RepID=UPI0004013DB2|nr:VOC family protein [Arthrobacter castelli]
MSHITPYICVGDCRAAIDWYVDGVAARVAEAGTNLDRGPEDTPHGRIAVFRDPFGHRWMLNDV